MTATATRPGLPVTAAFLDETVWKAAESKCVYPDCDAAARWIGVPQCGHGKLFCTVHCKAAKSGIECSLRHGSRYANCSQCPAVVDMTKIRFEAI